MNSRVLATGVVVLLNTFILVRAESGPSFARSGTVKVRVEGAATTGQLVERGGALVGDYDSFSIVEMPRDAVPAAMNVQVLEEENLVELNVGPIDTTTAAARQLVQPRGIFEGKSLHLVQFAGPIQPGWYQDLENTGVQIVTAIPSNAYLVYGDAQQLAAVQALAALSPHIQWNAEFLDEYKVNLAARPQNHVVSAQIEDNLYEIQLVADATANKGTLELIDQAKLAPIMDAWPALNYVNVHVALPMNQVMQVAHQGDVISINPWVIPTLNCEIQDQIIAGNLSGAAPSGPGYLAWLLSKGFTQGQFSSSNFKVDVTDETVDSGYTSPNHFGLWEGGIVGSVSHVAYARQVSAASVTAPIGPDCGGHGNLNCHIVGGYDDLAGATFQDASGFHFGLGVCPFVKVGSTCIFNPGYTNPNLTWIQSYAYNDGARISSNSWGTNVSGGPYLINSQTYDALVRDSEPTGAPFAATGNQEMCIVFANGNRGPGASTVTPPATGKNVISVGAAENVNMFGTDRCGWTNAFANSVNDMATFSSRGPCADGRKKPDIVAPGTHVCGGVPQAPSPGPTGTADPCFTGATTCGGPSGSLYYPLGQQFYTTSTGTSHSCPAVAGGCALVRQRFINARLNPPSPAMTKAVLMNSARWMSGGTGSGDTLWSNAQGMGEMDLGDAFDRTTTPSILQDEDTVNRLFTASGQTRTFTGNVANNTKPFRVTLAWTDAPGSTVGNAYLNNLDLTVTIGGNTYLGNVFDNTLHDVSATGGVADVANNVESVFLAAGVSGPFTVTVTATNINSDGVPNVGTATDQDFALIIYNARIPGSRSVIPQ